MKYELVLATDLDGTFLEGDLNTKVYFYNKLLSLQEQVLLIYTTGRPVEIVKSFCMQGYLPRPHYVLGDHGTHIVNGLDFAQIEHLQAPIASMWNQGNTLLRELLRNEAGIRLQPLNPPYRLAYFYNPQQLKKKTLDVIAEAGYDYVLSCDAYLDILPKGVGKGSSLIRIIDYLNIDHDLVVTCGDSLNDLSLFQTGLNSVAVGNSEPKLVEETKHMDNVYHSQLPGVHGIIDGLKHYDKFHLF